MARAGLSSPDITLLAFPSATCSKPSEGSLINIPIDVVGSASELEDCCTTCVNSCASSCFPSFVFGAYCPVPSTISLPTVNARAFTACADSAAFPSACTRTLLKSCPKRDSINACVSALSGWPGSPNTSRTTGGAARGDASGLPEWCCRNLLSPPGEVVESPGDAFLCFFARSLITQALHRSRVLPACQSCQLSRLAACETRRRPPARPRTHCRATGECPAQQRAVSTLLELQR